MKKKHNSETKEENMKLRFREENGSMAVYVSVVLLTMLIILTAVFFISNAVRRSEIQTVMQLKQSYEADNSRAAEIYDSLLKNQEAKYIFTEEFNSLPNYASVSTTWSVSNSILSLTASGNDPRVNMYSITSFDPQTYRYIEVRYKSDTNTTMEFFMIENPTNQTYAISGDIIGDGEWHVLTIDLWSNAAVKNRDSITGWRWDWCSEGTITMNVDYIKIRE